MGRLHGSSESDHISHVVRCRTDQLISRPRHLSATASVGSSCGTTAMPLEHMRLGGQRISLAGSSAGMGRLPVSIALLLQSEIALTAVGMALAVCAARHARWLVIDTREAVTHVADVRGGAGDQVEVGVIANQ